MSVSEFSDAGDTIVEMDRRRQDRRLDDNGTEPKDESSAAGTPRKRKQRRRQIDPTTCERDYNDEEISFMHAVDEYKRQSGRMFPTCSEILEVIRAMGYVRLGALIKQPKNVPTTATQGQGVRERLQKHLRDIPLCTMVVFAVMTGGFVYKNTR